MKKLDDDLLLFFIIPFLAFLAYDLFKGKSIDFDGMLKIIDKVQDESLRNLLKDEKKQANILKEVNKILKGKT